MLFRSRESAPNLLPKRTPLRRSKPLDRGAPIERRTPIARMSKKASKIIAARALLRKRLLTERGECEACGVRNPPDGFDLHERLSRGRGGSPTDPANVMLLCRTCHDWAHTHPAEAAEFGLLDRRWPR